MKFIITGTISVEVTASIEADSEEDAKSLLDSADCCVESNDADVVFTDCCQSGTEIDNVSCPSYDNWESLSNLERANILKENGASDEAAFESANLDFSDLPDEWQEYF